MANIVLPGQPITKLFRRFGVYSPPKYGKSRLITSLPWDRWARLLGDERGKLAAVICWDDGSEALEPVLEHHREHLVVVKPAAREVKGKLIFDPHKEAMMLASKDWSKGFEYEQSDGTKVAIPPVGTIIWDTMTTTAQDLLRGYADSGVFSGDKGDKHVSVGDVGTPTYLANPMMGDYGMAQQTILQILRMLNKQLCNVIVAFHTDYIEPEGAGQVTFGPAVVGKAAINTVSARFDNLFRLDIRPKTIAGVPPKTYAEYVCHTQKKGLYLGGLRSKHEKNPIPEVILNPDPVNFWDAVDETQGFYTKEK